MCREEERPICGSGNGRRGDRMKGYTEKDLEGFERDDFGRLICPSGDYTQIKSFGECCSFGERCSFGECCSFGERCRFEGGRVSGGRYVAVDRIGSEKRKTYFFADRDGNIFVRAGCWFSDLSAFKERVRDVHAGTRHEKEYLAACGLAELMLMEEERCS